MVLVFRQWGKVLPSPLHSQEPRARKGIKKSDLRVEMWIGKDLCPGEREGQLQHIIFPCMQCVSILRGARISQPSDIGMWPPLGMSLFLFQEEKLQEI